MSVDVARGAGQTPLKYTTLFIDLDNTVYDFSASSREAYREVYDELGYDRYFGSFEVYIALYEARNAELWTLYNAGRITKDELNAERYLHPLRCVGVADAEAVSSAFFYRAMEVLPTKGVVVPHAYEALDYLRPRYRLYILSNGFTELQTRKMQSAGLSGYFDGVVLSEDIGINKPDPRLFDYALRTACASAAEVLMIGDDFAVDVEGARRAGWNQMYYNPRPAVPDEPLPFEPTFEIRSLLEVRRWL